MYHSIYFGKSNVDVEDFLEKFANTWETWHLIPSSRPVFKPPAQKTQYIEIPGADGQLDFSEALTGYPVFENREGDLEFWVMNDYAPWEYLYTKIAEYVHGRKMKLVLEDDEGYFYTGRIEIEEWQSTIPWSTLTMNYNLEPYKWAVVSSTDEDWLWDPFNFEDGCVQYMIFKNSIEVDSDSAYTEFTFTNDEVASTAPICPNLVVTPLETTELTDDTELMYICYTNETLGIEVVDEPLLSGDNTVYDIILYGEDTYTFKVRGHGILSIDFRSGRL